MAWRTDGRADGGNAEWWSYRHDEHNTARYGTDARPPSPVRELRVTRTRASFLAPGDDWRAGKAKELLVRVAVHGSAHSRLIRVPAAAEGARQSVPLPRRALRVSVQAVDDAGNRGAAVRRRVRRR